MVQSPKTVQSSRAVEPLKAVQSPVADKIVEFKSVQNNQEVFDVLKEEVKKIQSGYVALKDNYSILETKITKLLYQTEEAKEQYYLLNLKLDYIISGGKKIPEIKITSHIKEENKVVYNMEKDPEVYNIGDNFILKFREEDKEFLISEIEGNRIAIEDNKEVFVRYLNKEYKIAPNFIQGEVQAYLDGDVIGVHNTPEIITTDQLIAYEGPILEEKKGFFGRKRWKESK